MPCSCSLVPFQFEISLSTGWFHWSIACDKINIESIPLLVFVIKGLNRVFSSPIERVFRRSVNHIYLYRRST